MKRRVSKAAAVLAGLGFVLFVSGCANKVKPDPAYAATRPQAVTPPPATAGAIYRLGYGISLFEDNRARRVGDILTILLKESISASKKANTKTSKKNELDIDNPTMFGKTLPLGKFNFTLDQNLKSEQEFDGEGSSTQKNDLSGTITVTVAEVLVNGNMVVRGEKLVTLNQGDEYVRISGIVRPQDVGPDNTILSTQVADARIVYGGKGVVADANANGWLGRFFLKPWWPF